MKKLNILFLLALVALLSACSGSETNSGIVKEQTIIGEEEDYSEELKYEDTTKIPTLENVNTITIDHTYWENEKETKAIYFYDEEYCKYGIRELNTLGMTYHNFEYDDTDISFSIISEVKLYENIISLIIQGKSEHMLGIWLVNYDKNKKISDFYTYVSSYPIGYNKRAESASWITSVIHSLPEPYIEQESVDLGIKKNSKIKMLQSGKFEVTETVESKYEMENEKPELMQTNNG